jgi:CBS domain-containing protein
MNIRDLLKMKDFKYRHVVTIGPNETISMAIQKLVEHDRGSLPVCDEKGELVGIITERDIVRKCFARSDAFTNIKIQDVMSKQVAIGNPEDDLDYAISVMKQKRIRHLPIMDNQEVVGMISMRDLFGVQLAEAKAEIRYAGLLHGRTHFGRQRLV